MIPANTAASAKYIGNGTQDTFTYPFRIYDVAELKVTIYDADGVGTIVDNITDFTATYKPFPLLGGTVTLVDSDQDWLDADGDLATGYTIFIEYIVNPQQDSNFKDYGPRAPLYMEKAFDKLTMDIIGLEDQVSRALVIPGGGGDDDNPELPPLIGNARKVLRVNDDETGYEYGPTVDEIQGWKDDAQTAASAAAASAIQAQDSVAQAAQYVDDAEAQVAAAAVQVGLATAQANAAAASATAAAGSVTAAAVQVALATTAATNSANFATASEIAANRTLFSTIVLVNDTNSPYNVTNADKGKLFQVDTTSGSFTFNLAIMSSVDPDFKIGIVKMSAANTITVTRNLANTINGSGTLVVSQKDFGVVIWPIFPGTDWRARYFILEGAAGTAGAVGYTFGTTQTLAANAKITPRAEAMQWLPVQGNGGPVTLNIDLFTAIPADGTIITLEGMDDTNYVVIPFSDTDGGSVANGDIYLKKYSTVTFVYQASTKRFKQTAGNGI